MSTLDAQLVRFLKMDGFTVMHATNTAECWWVLVRNLGEINPKP